MNHYNPDHVSNPGRTILDRMEESEFGIDRAAFLLDMSVEEVTIMIFSGRITPEEARRLDCAGFGPEDFWFNRSRNYWQAVLDGKPQDIIDPEELKRGKG